MGWEENAGEEEGLTEEEISAFFRENGMKYINSKASFRVSQGMQPRDSATVFPLKPLQIVSQVGEDEFGYMLANILKQNKVDNSGMRFDHNARTTLTFVNLRSDGELEFLFFRNPSADMLLHESELDVNLIK
ncbi:hypothetical protein RJ639_021320 [Escallonia herrerae]|uniref:Carbohydrate kinase PfkB domain-containing protein n=1 Tax=Escallonia herrerae TaxID=1293975 RepID=A0AA88V379_9ASTE|nr:hypothetical protein RJ639_021320 [Escallonia herrerae]